MDFEDIMYWFVDLYETFTDWSSDFFGNIFEWLLNLPVISGISEWAFNIPLFDWLSGLNLNSTATGLTLFIAVCFGFIYFADPLGMGMEKIPFIFRLGGIAVSLPVVYLVALKQVE
jgi:hypothetical protein